MSTPFIDAAVAWWAREQQQQPLHSRGHTYSSCDRHADSFRREASFSIIGADLTMICGLGPLGQLTDCSGSCFDALESHKSVATRAPGVAVHKHLRQCQTLSMPHRMSLEPGKVLLEGGKGAFQPKTLQPRSADPGARRGFDRLYNVGSSHFCARQVHLHCVGLTLASMMDPTWLNCAARSSSVTDHGMFPT